MSNVVRFEDYQNLPSHDGIVELLEPYLELPNVRAVADVGGGANPLIPQFSIESRDLHYHLFDISAEELEKSPEWCHERSELDVATKDVEQIARYEGQFDLIVSHMLVEHVPDMRQAHQNIYSMLRPGGFVVHTYASPYNFPLFINSIIPESISRMMLRIAQPNRCMHQHGKFPAHYDLCMPPGRRGQKLLESMGYNVMEYVGYVGHDYYKRFFPLMKAEQLFRGLSLQLGLPLTSVIRLVLQKPATADSVKIAA